MRQIRIFKNIYTEELESFINKKLLEIPNSRLANVSASAIGPTNTIIIEYEVEPGYRDHMSK